MNRGPNLIAINVGNTRIHAGLFKDGSLDRSQRWENSALPEVVQNLVKWWAEIADADSPTVLVASVNAPIGSNLASMLEDQLSIEVYRVGEDVPVPIGRQLDPETITGVDRLLNAAAAYDVCRQAVVVVDVGTAVTVDFVDGEGTFHGGAIAPGAQMQLNAMHEHTAALPELTLARPDDDAFGRSTAQAMLHGVYHGIRGMVRLLTERYAERYEAYPLVIVTGGNAALIFGEDELIDRIVPDLTLVGIATAARHALAVESDEDNVE